MSVLKVLPTVLQRFIWPGTRLILKFFGHFEIRGGGNIAQLPRGVIFAVNHSSEADAILVPAALPFFSRHLGMFYTSREQSFYKNSGWRQKIYGGLLFKVWGAYPVAVGVHNYEKSLATHIQLLKEGRSVCIFPEGWKTRTGALGTAKGGVAYLSLKSGKPVVPVAISGTFDLRFRNFLRRQARISVSFGVPLYPEDLFSDPQQVVIGPARDDCLPAAQKVMEEIGSLLSGDFVS